MIALDKKNGINLKKGSSISLEKEGLPLQHVCIGLNWGAIDGRGFFNTLFGSGKESVDLDGSVSMLSKGSLVETVYFKNLVSNCTAVVHSGDDLTGDLDGDDGLDNEIVSINLSAVDSSVDTIYFYLNSYQGHDFGQIPYSKIRIYEGGINHVDEVMANFNLSVEDKFKGYTSMIMGKLTRKGGNNWDFKAIGKPIHAKNIAAIERYLISYQASTL